MAKRSFLSIVSMVVMILVGFAGVSSVNAQDTQTGCLPGYDAASYTWGPAGPSPCSVQEAVRVLDAVSLSGDNVEIFVTVQNGTFGNPTPTGWVLATSGTEQDGTMFGARHVPAGVVVDFDPRASHLYGEYQYVDARPDWRRALLTSDGAFEGLKGTFYWTPVNWSGMTPQSTSEDVPSNLTTTSGQPDLSSGSNEGTVTVGQNGMVGTPTSSSSGSTGNSTTVANCTPEGAAALFSNNGAPLNDAASYRQESDTQVVFSSGAAYGPFEVPDGFAVDYDGAIDSSDGKAVAGDTVPGGSVFTLNCLAS